MDRAHDMHTYLGVVRAAVASRAVGHNVEHELPTSAGAADRAAREDEAGEQDARADYADGALQDSSSDSCP